MLLWKQGLEDLETVGVEEDGAKSLFLFVLFFVSETFEILHQKH